MLVLETPEHSITRVSKNDLLTPLSSIKPSASSPSLLSAKHCHISRFVRFPKVRKGLIPLMDFVLEQLSTLLLFPHLQALAIHIMETRSSVVWHLFLRGQRP